MSKKKSSDVNPEYINDQPHFQEAIREIGDLQREKSRLTDDANNRIQAIQSELTAKVAPIDDRIQALAKGLKLYSDSHRDEMIPKGKKSVEFPTGSIAYRSKPPAVKTRATGAFLEKAMEKLGLLDAFNKMQVRFGKNFLRIKVELDKESILKQPAKAEELLGIEVDGELERFYIKPATVDTEIEAAA